MNDTTTDGATSSTTELQEVTHTRVYAAPRELVFACMTTPEHLTHFWGPVGVSTPVENITVDLRPGGAFTTDMVNDATGEVYPTRGVYVEIVAPERLVWQEAGSDTDHPITTSITFTDLGDGRTEVVSHQTNLPPYYVSEEAQSGMLSSFDKFAAYVEAL